VQRPEPGSGASECLNVNVPAKLLLCERECFRPSRSASRRSDLHLHPHGAFEPPEHAGVAVQPRRSGPTIQVRRRDAHIEYPISTK